MKKLLITLFAFAALSWGQCGHIAFNPITGLMDCVGSASSGATVSSVGVVGTANQIAVSGASPITGAGTFTLSLPTNTVVPGVNGGTLTQAGSGLASGTYTSGITATGTIGQTCALTAFNNGNSSGTATVALTGSNTIAGGTALVITAAGSGNTSASTSSTAGNGSATCSGTAVVSTVLTGFALTFTTTATTNATLPSGTVTLASRLTGSGKIDFASINDGTCLNSTFTLTGAVAADAVVPEWPAAFNTSFVGTMFVSAADTIRVVACNLSGAAVDPASATYGAIIVR